MSHIMNGILVKNILLMLRIHVERFSIHRGTMGGSIMEIFMMIVFKINTGLYKLPISFIDVALHASSIVIDTTKSCLGCIVCRFGFPWTSQDCVFGPLIVKDRDKKSRVRVSVLPQRNNGFLNGTCFNPLIAIAHGGNHDLQYIGNTVGAAEYVASYASTCEEPDKRS